MVFLKTIYNEKKGDITLADIRNFEPLWGAWRTVKLLRQGAYGKVYLIEKVEMDKRYYAAVQYIAIPDAPDKSEMLYAEGMVSDDASLKDYYQQILDKLMSEINLNYRLKSNNIVSYEAHMVIPREHEPGFDVFIRMEFLTSLKSYTMRNSITLQDVLRLGEDICSALVVLQREKVRHWGIRPDDIYVNNDGEYKLSDIGAAQTVEGTDGDKIVKGTSAFMSPEVTRGEEGDYRAGLYSLGLVLYRLMNYNRGPFLPPFPKRVTDKMNKTAQKRRVQGEALPPPALADKSLSSIILKACTYERSDRWESAEQLRGALADYRQSLSEETAREVVVESKQRGDGAKTAAASAQIEADAATEEEVIEALSESEDNAYTPDADASVSLPSEETAVSLPDVDTTVPLPNDVSAVFLSNTDTIVSMPSGDAAIIHLDADETVSLPYEEVEVSYPITEAAVFPPVEELTFSMLRKEVAIHKPMVETKKKKRWAPIVVAVCAVVFVVILAIVLKFGEDGEHTGDNSSTHVWPSVAAHGWQDPVIEAGVRKALGAGKGKLDPNALAALEELRLSESDEPISTLADLAMLPGLKTLDLSGHPLKQFDFPEVMAQLTSLNLTGCGCTDLEFLRNPMLQGVINLALGSNQVSDLNSLAGLTQLNYLSISDNPVQDLAPLTGLSQLKTVIAQNVSVLDWSPIASVATVDGRPETIQPPETTPTPSESVPPANAPPSPSATPKPKPKPSTVAVASISLSRGSILLVIGDMVTLTAQVLPSDATNQKVTWSSSAPSVAKVDSNGNVTAVGNGTAIITASCGGRSATCAISIG